MLSKPHISELELESSTLALLNEYLSRFFDGQPHHVGGNQNVPFPACDLVFQQSPLDQPQSKPAISVLWVAPTSVSKCWETVNGQMQHMAYARARLTFLIRASAKGNARKQCTEAAQKLAGLLANNAATRPLAQKGIHRLRPGLPQSVQDNLHILRRLDAGLTLRYPILSQV